MRDSPGCPATSSLGRYVRVWLALLVLVLAGPANAGSGSPGGSSSLEALAAKVQTELGGITRIDAGADHVCALTAGGGVKCWGTNTSGQIGDNTATNRPTPVDVAGLTSGVIAIAVGGHHTCALTAARGVKCWGQNVYGQVGDSSTTNRLAPVDVSGLTSGVEKITAGDYHTCALTAGGGVRCWGWNGYGQLGDASTTNRSAPVAVTGLASGVSGMAAGSRHVCAVTSGGALKCWGWNRYGQIGDGSTTDRLTPVGVSGLSSGVEAVAGGYLHTCAVTTGGGAKCWGDNFYSQLGDSTTTQRLTPASVAGLSSAVAAVTAGDYFTCALTTAGGAKCWGDNIRGQVGDNTTSNRRVPVDVTGLTAGLSGISAGEDYTCALTATGGVKCWGNGSNGCLGDGTSSGQRAFPMPVIQGTRTQAITIGSPPAGVVAGGLARVSAAASSGLPVALGSLTSSICTIGGTTVSALAAGTCTIAANQAGNGDFDPAPQVTQSFAVGRGSQAIAFAGAPAISAGAAHTCALTAAGGVKCWGANGAGQLGDNTTTSRSTSADVSGLSSGVVAIASGDSHTCALMAAGAVKCWGDNLYSQLGNGTATDRLVAADVVGLSSGVVAIASGGRHACALTANGAVKCWGDDGSGQLGDNATRTDRNVPVDVTGFAGGIAAIAAGQKHTCAMTRGGAVHCWGENDDGQLGSADPRMFGSPVPLAVEGLASGVTAIVAGAFHTCALMATGAVKCWGRNASGQVGDNSTTRRITPVDVAGLGSGVAAVTAGNSHSCALTTAGAVKCWGNNLNGQVGDNSSTQRLAPVDVVGIGSAVVAVSAGAFHACALAVTGAVRCWGQDMSGQLGDNATITGLRTTPIDVLNLSSGGVTAVSGGAYHSCAISGGGVKCWGDNSFGQLGDGSVSRRAGPIDVTGVTSGVTAIGAMAYATCAIVAGGAKCWGNPGYNELGAPSANYSPVDVTGLSTGVSKLAAAPGGAHACVLTTAGAVKCWGWNRYGQLGDGSVTDKYPVDVVGLASGVASITAGNAHSCAVTSSGGAKCWGYNDYGQVGDGTTAPRLTPVDVSGLASGVAAIAAGGGHTCAILSAGAVKCWGSNSYGQLGDNSTTNSLTPVNVTGLPGQAVAIAAGGLHTCVLMATGGVKCWGLNSSGQLGDNSTTNRPAAVDVTGLASGVTSISSGFWHSCAVTSSGGVKCWGNNRSFQVGDFANLGRGSPVSVVDASSVAVPFGAIPTVNLGGTRSVIATTFNGLPVALTSLTPSTCSVSGSTVTGLATGTCTIAGNQPGNANFNAALQATLALLVVNAPAVASARLSNLSTRGQVQTGDNVMIGGFVIQGSGPKRVLVTAKGPSLSAYGVAGAMGNPALQLYSGQTVVAANDDWGTASNVAEIQATGVAPTNSQESAILVSLNPGAYTAVVSAVGGATGVGIVEVFELDRPDVPLVNLSTRGQVQTGDNVMIGGFVIEGSGAKTVLITAKGPSLAAYGVAGALANPTLNLYSGQTVIASNDDWGSAGNANAIQATGLAPSDSREAAILISLQPGAYTAIVSGAGGSTGVGIVEVFAQ